MGQGKGRILFRAHVIWLRVFKEAGRLGWLMIPNRHLF